MARKKFEGGQISCSFCGKTQREVRKLIAGPTVYICNECIQLCTEIIDEERNSDDANKEERPLPTPHEITAYLDNYVIGQERAKKVLSVAIYNHYKRILSIESIASKKNEGEGSSTDSKMEDKTNGKGAKGKQVEEQHKQKTEHSGVELQKSNVLLVGPTGTGKTLLAQTLAKIIDVPFTMADATTLTEAGYVGEDVENILAGLLAAADNDVERAERGIIYIDEIDKIAGGSDSPSMTRDVSGEGVQQALLKIIEGTVANIPPRGGKKYGQTEMTSLDTTNILVICGGSFTGIEDVIQRRVGKQGMGFGGDIKSKKKQRVGEYLQKIEPQDLNKFGLIPEFIGRLPVLTTLDDLDETDLSYILTKPKNALLKQYKKLFSLEQVELIFSADAIAAITVEATKRRTGARGLRAILEEAMLEIMYEVPFLEGIKSCEITAEVIAGTGDPKLTFHILKSA